MPDLHSGLFVQVEKACRKAVSAWNKAKVGVTFVETTKEKEATFLIDYKSTSTSRIRHSTSKSANCGDVSHQTVLASLRKILSMITLHDGIKLIGDSHAIVYSS